MVATNTERRDKYIPGPVLSPTDAADGLQPVQLGCSLRDFQVSGIWSDQEKRLSFDALELLAVIRALRAGRSAFLAGETGVGYI